MLIRSAYLVSVYPFVSQEQVRPARPGFRALFRALEEMAILKTLKDSGLRPIARECTEMNGIERE
jgi:hypothetical protein